MKIKTYILYFLLSLCCTLIFKLILPDTASALTMEESNHTIALRSKMIHEQLERRGIKSRQVLDAFQKVPRHLFVPENLRDKAYEDRALPIGNGQTISQPYIVAFMTEALNLTAGDRVLEVGTGSGYQAAILAEICDTVYSIEIIESLGKRAGKLLQKIGYTNIELKLGDGYQGWKSQAPFDAIIVTCAPTRIPEPLKEQLAEGGRMIIPVGKQYVQELVLLEKKNNRVEETKVLPVMFVPMVDERGKVY